MQDTMHDISFQRRSGQHNSFEPKRNMANRISKRRHWRYKTGTSLKLWNFSVKFGFTRLLFSVKKRNRFIFEQPHLFEEIVLETSRQARETVVACGPREGPLFNNPTHQTLYHNTVKTLFTSFTRCLQQLAFSGYEDAMDNDETSVSQLIGSPSNYKSKTNKHQGPVRSVYSYIVETFVFLLLFFISHMTSLWISFQTWEQRLLISLSNIQYTLTTVLSRIEDALKMQSYPDLRTANGWTNDWTQLEKLDNEVLDAYLERRCDPLVGTIEPSMYLGGLEWDFDTKPTHLKPYAQEILANLIAVHAEVMNFARLAILFVTSLTCCLRRCVELRRFCYSEFCPT